MILAGCKTSQLELHIPAGSTSHGQQKEKIDQAVFLMVQKSSTRSRRTHYQHGFLSSVYLTYREYISSGECKSWRKHVPAAAAKKEQGRGFVARHAWTILYVAIWAFNGLVWLPTKASGSAAGPIHAIMALAVVATILLISRRALKVGLSKARCVGSWPTIFCHAAIVFSTRRNAAPLSILSQIL